MEIKLRLQVTMLRNIRESMIKEARSRECMVTFIFSSEAAKVVQASVAYACNPSTQGVLRKEASPGYTVSSNLGQNENLSKSNTPSAPHKERIETKVQANNSLLFLSSRYLPPQATSPKQEEAGGEQTPSAVLHYRRVHGVAGEGHQYNNYETAAVAVASRR